MLLGLEPCMHQFWYAMVDNTLCLLEKDCLVAMHKKHAIIDCVRRDALTDNTGYFLNFKTLQDWTLSLYIHFVPLRQPDYNGPSRRHCNQSTPSPEYVLSGFMDSELVALAVLQARCMNRSYIYTLV